MAASYWLVKSEPSTFSWDQLVKDGKAVWDGVRNFTARNNLRGMKKGDVVLFYHSNEGKSVVGIARVTREAYPDPTAKGEDWSAVDLEPVKPMTTPVSLEQMRGMKPLADMQLLRLSRLSVSQVTKSELDTILKAGGTKLP
jgi:predicted RNA-binding protein with PUA-like domain